MKQQERDDLLLSLVKGQKKAELQAKDLSDKVSKINRGLYGDVDNNAPGLIEKQAMDDTKFKHLGVKIDKNTGFRKKAQRIFAGTSITTGLVAGSIALFFDKVKTLILNLFTQ